MRLRRGLYPVTREASWRSCGMFRRPSWTRTAALRRHPGLGHPPLRNPDQGGSGKGQVSKKARTGVVGQCRMPKYPNTQIPKDPNTQRPKHPNTQTRKEPRSRRNPNIECPKAKDPECSLSDFGFRASFELGPFFIGCFGDNLCLELTPVRPKVEPGLRDLHRHNPTPMSAVAPKEGVQRNRLAEGRSCVWRVFPCII